jgi:heme exporter protein A
MIDARRVVKAFGYKPVLRGIDLGVAPGELVALVGPNGASKTTLMRILATLSRPTAGEIVLAGQRLPRGAEHARREWAWCCTTLLYDNLTAEENLRFYGRLMPARSGRPRRQVLEVVGLSTASRQARTLSRGQQQRLSIARALLHGPDVLLLDEPYTGLDVAASATFDTLLRDLVAQGHTVLMTIHDLVRGFALSDRVLILARGKIARSVPGRSARRSSPGCTRSHGVMVERERIAERDPDGPGRGRPGGGRPRAGARDRRGAVEGPGRRAAQREMISAMVVFALLTVITFNFALELRMDRAGLIAPGLIWVTILFAGRSA